MKLYGVCIGQGPIYIVTELMVNGKWGGEGTGGEEVTGEDRGTG